MLGGFTLLGGIARGLLDATQIKRKQQLQSHLDKTLESIGIQAALQIQNSPNIGRWWLGK